MAVVYVLAHFDDEYAALPLIREAQARGQDQRFLYLADYRSPQIAQRRLGETRAFLRRFGLSPEAAQHVGLGSGAQDGQLHRHAVELLPRLQAALAEAGPAERFVIAAWEGGHQDHDVVAAMTAQVAQGAPIDQFALYNRRGLGALPFQAGVPIPENGPVRKVRLGLGDWLAWAGAAIDYPSPARTWMGLWPSMFANYARLGGFGVQAFAPARLNERPHDGDLLYERRFGVAYADVARAAAAVGAAVRAAPGPA